MKVMLNAELVEYDKAFVSVSDRGFTHGDGLFETFRSYDGKPFLLDRHLKRMWDSADYFGLKMPFPQSEAGRWARILLEANGLRDARFRMTMTRGLVSGPLGGMEGETPVALMTATRLDESLSSVVDPKKVELAPWARHSSDPIVRHKTLSYLGNLKARMAAKAMGVDELIFLNEKGAVTEGGVSNLFWVKSNTLFTPHVDEGLLAGVTRSLVLELGKETGIECREVKNTLPEAVMEAGEIFLTNSLWEIRPVGRFRDRDLEISPGPVTLKLMQVYEKRTQN